MKAAPTVQPLLTFGQCLKNILGARKLSASALSRMMEQKSRNSMFRILDDTGGPAVQAAFFESLKASDCLRLTEQEERELERALEVSRFGVAGYMTNQAMHRLLGDVDLQAAADDSLRVDRSRDGSVTTLRESMERLAAEQKRVHFVITGCCYRRVLERIAAAFAGSACEMSIEHYLYTGGDEIIGCVSAIQPVLYLPGYKGYCIDENMFNIQREQVYRCNTITAHCEDAQGKKQVLMAVMIDPQRLLSIGSPDERNIEIVERMMREDRPKMHPIKREFQTSGSPEGYLAYTKSLQRLEQGRSIYDIKLDVPINFVAPEVLVGPARDGFAAHGFAQDDALEEMIGQFYKVHQKRFDNYFQKRRPTHAIFSRQAMEQFAQTGLESDHFFRHPSVQPGGARFDSDASQGAERNQSEFLSLFLQAGISSATHGNLPVRGRGHDAHRGRYGLRPFRRALGGDDYPDRVQPEIQGVFHSRSAGKQSALACGDAEDVRGFDRNREKRINAGGFTQLPI